MTSCKPVSCSGRTLHRGVSKYIKKNTHTQKSPHLPCNYITPLPLYHISPPPSQMFHLLQLSYRELKKYFARLPSCYFTSWKNTIFPDVAYFTVHTVRVVANVPPTTQFCASAMLLLRQCGVSPMITNFVKICQSFQTFQWRTDTPGHIAWRSYKPILSCLGTQVVKTSGRTSQRTQPLYTTQTRTNQLMQLRPPRARTSDTPQHVPFPTSERTEYRPHYLHAAIHSHGGVFSHHQDTLTFDKLSDF